MNDRCIYIRRKLNNSYISVTSGCGKNALRSYRFGWVTCPYCNKEIEIKDIVVESPKEVKGNFKVIRNKPDVYKETYTGE